MALLYQIPKPLLTSKIERIISFKELVRKHFEISECLSVCILNRTVLFNFVVKGINFVKILSFYSFVFYWANIYTWHYRHILATLHTLTSAILFSLPLPPVRPENNRKKQITLFWRPPFVNQEGYQFLLSDYIFATGSPLHIGCFNTMPCKKWRTNEIIYFLCIYLYFRHPFIH